MNAQTSALPAARINRDTAHPERSEEPAFLPSRRTRSSAPIAGAAFDTLAPGYDALWTRSVIGRSQRSLVWREALRVFQPGSHILELNCGTGEDALFLARAGMQVTACDASHGMIREAETRKAAEDPDAAIRFLPIASEDVAQIPAPRHFDGVFSNFSGLNCVRDLPALAGVLHTRLAPGAPLLLCLSTRFCLWEMAFYLLQGKPRKAFRRCGGVSEANLHGLRFPVYYPTLLQVRRAFSPGFRLRSVRAVGLAVPPSYLEACSTRHPRLFAALERLDRALCSLPGLRVLGDHMLLHLETV